MAEILGRSDPVVLLVAHGSRDPSANREFDVLVESFRRRISFPILGGYLTHAEPDIHRALSSAVRLSQSLVLIPLGLFLSSHMKNDIPAALEWARRRWPCRLFYSGDVIGTHQKLIQLAIRRVQSVTSLDDGSTGIAFIGRGSSDPDANGEFFRVSRLFQENLKFIPVEPAFIGITKPTVEEGIISLVDRGVKKIVVFPYLLFAGRLVEKVRNITAAMRERFPTHEIHLADHLGVSPEIYDVLADRIWQAIHGESGRLQCDNCDYRISSHFFPRQIQKINSSPIPPDGREIYENDWVGFSDRRSPLARHVLICCGSECVSRGSMVIMEKLKEELRKTGEGGRIRVTGTSRLDFCQFGPTLTIYPEGIWYGQVTEHDIPEIVEKHLLGNNVISRLMFLNPMVAASFPEKGSNEKPELKD